MKIELIITFILIFTVKASAQNTKPMKAPIFGIYLATGMNFVNLDKLNSAFELNNIEPTPKNRYFITLLRTA